MEDLPRIPEKSDDKADKTEAPVPHVESLMSRWQKMIESDKDSKGREEKDDDEDEEEDSEASSASNTVGKIKNKKLGHSLRAFMPQAEQIIGDGTEDKPVETPEADDNIPQSAHEEIVDTPELPDVGHPYESSVPLEFPDSELQPAPQESLQDYTEQRLFQENSTETDREDVAHVEEIEITPTLLETNGDDPQNIETPSITPEQVVAQPMPEPESIQQILQRQEEIRTANLPQRNSTMSGESIDSPSRNAIRGNEVYSRNPTRALLAIDAANYLSARHRDKKNMKKVDSELSNVTREQSKQNDEIDSRILRQEKQHNQDIQKIEKLHEKTQIKSESRFDKIDNKQVEKVAVKEKVVVPQAEINTELYQYNSQNVRGELSPDNRRLGFEETLHKVSEVGTGNIKSEFEFERRHEVMDEPGGSVGMMYGEQSPEFDQAAQRAHSALVSTDSHDASVQNPTSKTSSDSTYKQAATTGFWGAVVGIIVFIIIYMLSRG